MEGPVGAPTLILLHGWTATADLNFFMCYRALSEHFRVIAIDHRGHGRGIRSNNTFRLSDCADDAAAVAKELGATTVITVGYSMGGPISLLTAQRHPELVEGMVLQATALEWSGTRKEKNRMRFIGPMAHFISRPRVLRFFFNRTLPRGHETRRYVSWMIAENRRNDPWMIAEAGMAISKFDARGFAHTVDVPAGFVLTTKDRSVPPEKQAALASALRATVVEFHADHMGTLQQPREYAAAMRESVDAVIQQIR